MPRTVSPQITIRPAQKDDIAPLAAALEPDVSPNQLARRWQEHQDGHREMLVAVLDGQPVGTVSTGGYRHRRPDSLRMFALDVGPAFRRRGNGASLVAAVGELACRRSLQAIHLEVAVENVEAIRLYERLGFQQQGDPILDRWWRLTTDGSHEQVEELSSRIPHLAQTSDAVNRQLSCFSSRYMNLLAVFQI